jgi:SAM-dependent methyltransferase
MAEPTLQQWHPESYEAKGRFVSDLGAPVLALLDPQPGERVLDLGCGDGALTEQLVALGARVIGVDASAAMVAGARARGLEAQVPGGFGVESITLIPRPTPRPGDPGDWITTFAQGFLTPVPPEERQALVAEVVEALRPQLLEADGCWRADDVRLRFRAIRR